MPAGDPVLRLSWSTEPSGFNNVSAVGNVFESISKMTRLLSSVVENEYRSTVLSPVPRMLTCGEHDRLLDHGVVGLGPEGVVNVLRCRKRVVGFDFCDEVWIVSVCKVEVLQGCERSQIADVLYVRIIAQVQGPRASVNFAAE